MNRPIRVAFVDDDPHVLRGLRRAMAAMEEDWEMDFFASGEEILEEITHQPFDVVVSDMRMPGMDGATLLNRIRDLYPSTIRVILSGYADATSVLRTIGPAHIYLAKPCDAATLHRALRRQIALRTRLDDPGLRATLAGLSNLPSLPRVFTELQRALASPDISPRDVAEIIAQDLAMTAQLLKVTNSAYFTAANNVATPLQAVRLLGLELVQALVVQAGVFRQFSGRPDLAAVLEHLTQHALAVSALAEHFTTAAGGDATMAKTARIAGMLADIGRLVLLDAHPETYPALLATLPPGQSLPEAEKAAFGADQATIGAYLLGLWGFSDLVIEALAYRDRPSSCPDRDNLALAALHAATRLGPPSPLRPAQEIVPAGLDVRYLIEARLDGLIPAWRALASGQNEEVKA